MVTQDFEEPAVFRHHKLDLASSHLLRAMPPDLALRRRHESVPFVNENRHAVVWDRI